MVQLSIFFNSNVIFPFKLYKIVNAPYILDDWWSAYGGSATELQRFAWRIVGLYCSASGYDRNWTMFDCVSNQPSTANRHRCLCPLGREVH